MARKRFTPEQIVAILREAERGTERKALFRRHGISERTFYRWKRMYGGLVVSEVRRHKTRPEDLLNVLIREELKRLSERHRRYGTPRMTELIRRRGYRVNHKRIERLWKLEGLPIRTKRRRKLKKAIVSDGVIRARKPNEVWSYDFLHDRTEYGQKLKLLTVLDEHTRECLEIRVEKRMDSRHVMETLDELMTERGVPRYTRSDNEALFVCKRLTRWLREKGVMPVFIEPGSPWENGFVESFQGKVRDECLNEEIF